MDHVPPQSARYISPDYGTIIKSPMSCQPGKPALADVFGVQGRNALTGALRTRDGDRLFVVVP